MGENEQVLSSFYDALVEVIHAQRPDYLTGPFTVAEIYQNLVPYGLHRDRIGVEMNGDYEDALLHLLAGEGGYLILESEAALRNLREELKSPNPNTGAYREYAAVDVRLNPDRLSGPSVVSEEVPVDDTSLHEAEDDVGAGFLGPEEDDPPREVPESEPVGADEALTACRWCRADLPKRPTVNFCPFCGTDVHVVSCPGCGEELEPEWRFCAACGVEVHA